MASEIVHPFGSQEQNTQQMSVRVSCQFKHETHSTLGDYKAQFIQDLEIGVCAKLNTVVFNTQEKKAFVPKFTPESLHSKRQSQPYSLLRHMVCFLLYHHPVMQGHFSTPMLGLRYGRDHTTIVSGLRRMESFINARHAHAFRLQEVCDRLANKYGAFDIWRYVGFDSRPSHPFVALNSPEARAKRVRERARVFDERNRRMVALYNSGLSIAVVAERFGMSRTATGRILHLHGDGVRTKKQAMELVQKRRRGNQ